MDWRLLRHKDSCGKMERTLPEATQCSWWHRTNSASMRCQSQVKMLEQSPAWKTAKNLMVVEFIHQSLRWWFSMTSVKKEINRLWERPRNSCPFFSKQYLLQDSPQQTLNSHSATRSYGYTMWLQLLQEHRCYDILSLTTTIKVQDRPLYMVCVDITKAFDTFGGTGLWQLLSEKMWILR